MPRRPTLSPASGAEPKPGNVAKAATRKSAGPAQGATAQGTPPGPTEAPAATPADPPEVPFPAERDDPLVRLCDLCAEAERIAVEQGEKLLAYLLSMATQEGRGALRRRIAGDVGLALSGQRTRPARKPRSRPKPPSGDDPET